MKIASSPSSCPSSPFAASPNNNSNDLSSSPVLTSCRCFKPIPHSIRSITSLLPNYYWPFSSSSASSSSSSASSSLSSASSSLSSASSSLSSASSSLSSASSSLSSASSSSSSTSFSSSSSSSSSSASSSSASSSLSSASSSLSSASSSLSSSSSSSSSTSFSSSSASSSSASSSSSSASSSLSSASSSLSSASSSSSSTSFSSSSTSSIASSSLDREPELSLSSLCTTTTTTDKSNKSSSSGCNNSSRGNSECISPCIGDVSPLDDPHFSLPSSFSSLPPLPPSSFSEKPHNSSRSSFSVSAAPSFSNCCFSLSSSHFVETPRLGSSRGRGGRNNNKHVLQKTMSCSDASAVSGDISYSRSSNSKWVASSSSSSSCLSYSSSSSGGFISSNCDTSYYCCETGVFTIPLYDEEGAPFVDEASTTSNFVTVVDEDDGEEQTTTTYEEEEFRLTSLGRRYTSLTLRDSNTPLVICPRCRSCASIKPYSSFTSNNHSTSISQSSSSSSSSSIISNALSVISLSATTTTPTRGSSSIDVKLSSFSSSLSSSLSSFSSSLSHPQNYYSHFTTTTTTGQGKSVLGFASSSSSFSSSNLTDSSSTTSSPSSKLQLPSLSWGKSSYSTSPQSRCSTTHHYHYHHHSCHHHHHHHHHFLNSGIDCVSGGCYYDDRNSSSPIYFSRRALSPTPLPPPPPPPPRLRLHLPTIFSPTATPITTSSNATTTLTTTTTSSVPSTPYNSSSTSPSVSFSSSSTPTSLEIPVFSRSISAFASGGCRESRFVDGGGGGGGGERHGLTLTLPPRGGDLDFTDFGYEHISVLSHGHFGCAHLVRSFEDDELWVAKVVDLSELDPREVKHAVQEAEYLRRLQHPNIVKYRDSFFTDSSLVIVMEYCAGGDLFTQIVEMEESEEKEEFRRQRFTEQQVLQWFSQIVHGLQYMHSQRIIHCDLKTTNIFLTSDGIAKIGDLGIARELQKERGILSPEECPRGTPLYMSPEMCRRQPLTDKSDCWSLGCILYEMCCLAHAFQGHTPDELLNSIENNFRSIKNEVPEVYSQITTSLVEQLLQKAPEHRASLNRVLEWLYFSDTSRSVCPDAVASPSHDSSTTIVSVDDSSTSSSCPPFSSPEYSQDFLKFSTSALSPEFYPRHFTSAASFPLIAICADSGEH